MRVKFNKFLHCIDLNEIDKLFIEYDKTIAPKITADDILGLLDAASILWRLNVSIIRSP